MNVWLLLIFSVSTLFLRAQCGPCFRYHEAVTNGNFSAGNNGFTSSLNAGSGFFCPLCPEGTFAVGINAWIYHNGFTGFDHTNPGNGLFFIANSAPAAGTPVWCQTVEVEPFTDYTVEFWGRDVANNPDPHPLAELRWSFNGTPFGDTLICAGGWQLSQDVWNSGLLTSVEACIVNWQEDMGGNDFGLDDISIHACFPIVLSAAAEAGPDTLEVCSNIPVPLGSVPMPGYTYQWSASSGLNNANIANPIFMGANDGVTTEWLTLVVATDSAAVGCISTDTVHLALLPAPMLAIDAAPVVCEGDSIWISASPGFDAYTWNTGGESNGIYVSNGGIYSVSAQAGSCIYEVTAEIAQPILPDLSSLPTQIVFCETDSVMLTAPVPVWWNGTVFTDQWWVYSAGSYTASLSIDGCTAEASVLAVEDTIPMVNLLPHDTWCEGATIALQSTLAGLWNTGEVGTTITITAPGMYSVTAVNGACQHTASLEIPWLQLPRILLPSDTLICELEPTRLLAGTDEGVTYAWSTGDSTAYAWIAEAGTYAVSATNACGTKEHTIVADTWPCMWNVYAPSAFSPNGDGINDRWKVEAWNVQNIRIRVYDKLGNMVFATNRLDEDWAPNSGGNEAFVYRIEAIDQDGKEIALHGHILALP